MSLPYYEPTKYAYQTQEQGPPPEYEEQSVLLQVPILTQREITFRTLIWTTDVLSFTSPDAATKYKSFKKIKKKDASFKHVVDLQQLGIGLPLMEAQFKRFRGFGETKFATIFKCVPSPPGSDLTFDKKTDKFKFCAIQKKREWHHTRYTFTILPNKNNPSDTFQFSMFWHSKMPIIDVTPIRGSHRKYRWINSIPRRYCREDFTYTLYALDEKQKSMVDNMDVANRKLDKANSILNTKSCKFSKEKINEYRSMDGAGELVTLLKIGVEPQYLPKDKVAELTREEGHKIVMSILQEDNKPSHVFQTQDVDLESIDSVSVHELALTCMSYVINFVEEARFQNDLATA